MTTFFPKKNLLKRVFNQIDVEFSHTISKILSLEQKPRTDRNSKQQGIDHRLVTL